MEILLPSNEGESLKQFEFRVTLDPHHGFLPSKIDSYIQRGQEMDLHSEVNVAQFREFKPNLWAPVEMTYSGFDSHPGINHGKAVNEYHVVVDTDRSRWASDLESDLFVSSFPAGTRIVDLRQNDAVRPKPQFDLAKVCSRDQEAARATHKIRSRVKNQCGRSNYKSERHG